MSGMKNAACRCWISAKANGHSALTHGFQWRKSLCSLHWKGRTILLFFVCSFLGKRHTGVLSCSNFGKKADKTKGPVSVQRLLRHRLSGARSGICHQALSKPLWDGPLGGVAISDLIREDILQEGSWNFTAPSTWLTCSGTTASHLWDLWEGRAALTNWPHLCWSPKPPYLGESLAMPCLCKGPDTLRDSQLLWTSWGKLLGSKFH